MTQRLRTFQRLQRLVVLNRAGLLHVQRLLVVGELAFQLIHFQFSGLCAGFVLFLQIGRFGDDFILLFKTNLQFIEIRFITLDFFLLAQRGLYQIQVVAGSLIIGFQIAFCAVMFLQFTSHIDVLILLCRQLRPRGKEIATILQRFVQMHATFVGVTHIVRRNIVRRFADQVFKQVAIGLGDANGFERHAVFAQRGFHILECFTYAAVFRQQVVAQRAGNSVGDPAIQRGFNQAIVFAAIGSRTQTTRDNAQIEHQRVIIGYRVELLELHPFHLFKLVFQLVETQHARLALVKGFRQQLGRLNGHRQPLDSKRLDIHFTIATGDLLQAHAHDHALVVRVDHVQYRITHPGPQLPVQTFIARTAGGPRFGGVAEVQQGQVRNQCRDESRHGGRFPGAVAAGEGGDQLIQIKGAGKKTVPVNQRQRAKFTAFNHYSSSPLSG